MNDRVDSQWDLNRILSAIVLFGCKKTQQRCSDIDAVGSVFPAPTAPSSPARKFIEATGGGRLLHWFVYEINLHVLGSHENA